MVEGFPFFFFFLVLLVPLSLAQRAPGMDWSGMLSALVQGTLSGLVSWVSSDIIPINVGSVGLQFVRHLTGKVAGSFAKQR